MERIFLLRTALRGFFLLHPCDGGPPAVWYRHSTNVVTAHRRGGVGKGYLTAVTQALQF